MDNPGRLLDIGNLVVPVQIFINNPDPEQHSWTRIVDNLQNLGQSVHDLLIKY